ncbi:hypothetical protein K353_05817 [Kitasatospora sp. SolWspMP-SS2h]|uniref:hypothetical protein n=1 Tax=Kitasatospora sp. SolWspMP-SS2h TaxID=1305729 RepID=UPI000DB9E57F|nr:hypothetical protein [Kitasatospora sp. SolWspMP-SS2h]RAJ32819.1 hypothetical protein K353_05817 [Kitasatospora sp. SolWspMP-SS2h]
MDSLPAPGPVTLVQHPDEEQRQALRLDHQDTPYETDEREQRALARAAEAGRAAARWVRELAGRQGEHTHAQALLNAAEAVEAASGTAIVPGGQGVPGEEGGAPGTDHRQALLPGVLLGPVHHTQDVETLPALTGTERLDLVAACTLAAAMPSTTLGYYPLELEALTGALEAAVRSGRGILTGHRVRQR